MIFDYGVVDTNLNKFDENAGKYQVEIAVKSYNNDFSAEAPASEQAGEMIYLGITLEGNGFVHADSL